MSKHLAALCVCAVSWLTGAWLLMITVDVIHDRWIPALPTIGYNVALLIGALLMARSVLSAFAASIIKGLAE